MDTHLHPGNPFTLRNPKLPLSGTQLRAVHFNRCDEGNACRSRQTCDSTAPGRYDSLIHDWNYLFTQLGVLSYATVIAGVVRSIGCLGMIGVTFWCLWRAVADMATYGDF